MVLLFFEQLSTTMAILFEGKKRKLLEHPLEIRTSSHNFHRDLPIWKLFLKFYLGNPLGKGLGIRTSPHVLHKDMPIYSFWFK